MTDLSKLALSRSGHWPGLRQVFQNRKPLVASFRQVLQNDSLSATSPVHVDSGLRRACSMRGMRSYAVRERLAIRLIPSEREPGDPVLRCRGARQSHRGRRVALHLRLRRPATRERRNEGVSISRDDREGRGRLARPVRVLAGSGTSHGATKLPRIERRRIWGHPRADNLEENLERSQGGRLDGPAPLDRPFKMYPRGFKGARGDPRFERPYKATRARRTGVRGALGTSRRTERTRPLCDRRSPGGRTCTRGTSSPGSRRGRSGRRAASRSYGSR